MAGLRGGRLDKVELVAQILLSSSYISPHGALRCGPKGSVSPAKCVLAGITAKGLGGNHGEGGGGRKTRADEGQNCGCVHGVDVKSPCLYSYFPTTPTLLSDSRLHRVCMQDEYYGTARCKGEKIVNLRYSLFPPVGVKLLIIVLSLVFSVGGDFFDRGKCPPRRTSMNTYLALFSPVSLSLSFSQPRKIFALGSGGLLIAPAI